MSVGTPKPVALGSTKNNELVFQIQSIKPGRRRYAILDMRPTRMNQNAINNVARRLLEMN